MATPNALSSLDLKVLSAYELGAILNQIDVEDAIFSQVGIETERALGVVEEQFELAPTKELKAQIKRATRELKAVDRQLQALRRRQSRIQSLLKNMGPQPT